MVFDASTLILLAKIGMLGLVAKRRRMTVTPVVRQEVMQKDSVDAKWIERLMREERIELAGTARRTAEVRRLEQDFRLAAGEASSLWLARQTGDVLATDDGPAIRACKVCGVPFVTAVHLLVESCEQGEISVPLALEKLGKLARHGRYQPRILADARSRLEKGQG